MCKVVVILKKGTKAHTVTADFMTLLQLKQYIIPVILRNIIGDKGLRNRN